MKITPQRGDWAVRIDLPLDARQIDQVSDDGTQIKLAIGRITTDWLPVELYRIRPNKQSITDYEYKQNSRRHRESLG